LPVIFGPNHEKFQEALDLIHQGGAFTIHNYNDFERIINLLLNDQKILQEKGAIASTFVKQKTGATEKILQTIKIFLS